MDLRHLRYFIATVEEGSLQAAAARMNVAQPAMSRRIRDLEADLGCSLLTRSSRGVSPTRAGEAFYRNALHILENLDEARYRAARIGREDADVPRLGIIVTSRKLPFVQEAVAAYSDRFPDAPISFQRDLSPDLAGALRERRLDMSLLYEWRLESEAIGARLIHHERYVLAMHPRHPLARTTEPVRLADLRDQPLIWLSRGELSVSNDWLMRQCQLRGLDPVVTHIARTHDEQVDLVVVSGGAFITPASLVLDIHRDFLVVRPLAETDLEISLSLAWVSDPLGKPAGALLALLHSAIDRYQREILSNRSGWATINGHTLIRVPENS